MGKFWGGMAKCVRVWREVRADVGKSVGGMKRCEERWRKVCWSVEGGGKRRKERCGEGMGREGWCGERFEEARWSVGGGEERCGGLGKSGGGVGSVVRGVGCGWR